MRTVVRMSGWLALVGLSAVWGCPEPSTGGFALARLPGADRQEAFAAAATALRSQGFRIAEADEDLGRIQTHPLESSARDGTDRLHEAAVKVPSRVRRIATVYIRQSEGAFIAHCRVQLQRLDTAQQDVFARQREFADVPSETPIDLGAGMTTGQTETWTDLRRDRMMERQILQAIRERTVGSSATTAAGG